MSELTAALATIEKCRELTGCPAGVDLQDHLRQLAAENVGLKVVSVKLFNMGYRRGHETTVESCYVDIHWSDIGEYHEDVVAEIIEDETPATDRIYAGIKADGAEACVRALVTSDDDDFTDAPNICAEVARSLREGASHD